MALIRRVSRLITADVHALLDQLESPRAVLRQSIREMEDRLDALDARIRRAEAAVAADDKRLEALGRSMTETDARLDLCLAEENDTLARRIVRRKLELTRLIEAARATRDARTDEHASLTALAARQHDELECTRRKAAVFLDTDSDCMTGRQANAAAIDEAEVEIALIAERQARRPR